MPEILIDMLEEEFPEENYTLFNRVYLKKTSPSDENPESRVAIHIQRRNPYDGVESGQEVVIDLNRRMPLNEETRHTYVDSLGIHFERRFPFIQDRFAYYSRLLSRLIGKYSN